MLVIEMAVVEIVLVGEKGGGGGGGDEEEEEEEEEGWRCLMVVVVESVEGGMGIEERPVPLTYIGAPPWLEGGIFS